MVIEGISVSVPGGEDGALDQVGVLPNYATFSRLPMFDSCRIVLFRKLSTKDHLSCRPVARLDALS